MAHTMSHGFHACDSFEHITWFMSFDWLNGMLCDDSYELLMNFALWLTTSHRGLCSARWWVTGVRVEGRCLYKARGSDQEIGSSPNHLSTFLYLRYCNTIIFTLFLYTSPLPKPTPHEPGDYCDSLDGPLRHRTIVIVLSSTTTHSSHYLTR